MASASDAAAPTAYPLPANIADLDRNARQHELFKHLFDGNLHHTLLADAFASSADGAVHVLDVGCGSGLWAIDFARRYPGCKVVGVDSNGSEFPPADDVPPNVSFVTADVVAGLPFADATFTLVYQRNMVLSYPTASWGPVVKELKRVTKPDGYVELVECFFAPQRAGKATGKMSAWFFSAMEDLGLNAKLAQNLDIILDGAGFKSLSKGVRSAPSNWSGPVGETVAADMRAIYVSLAPILKQKSGLSDAEYEPFVDEVLKEHAENKSFVNWFFANGRV
ncbi:S-adenosyl-L-methionine-dependent methyltransferase [Zopfochytrium polystomum]|nr:S-adenosyl-L-methionine-dependent methyltransferase [Zopfochytrium polystomum]